MIMNNKKISYEDSKWDMYEAQIKMKTFLIMHYLNEYNILTNFSYGCIILIENLQYMYFTIHPTVTGLYATAYFGYFQAALQYFQFDYIMQASTNTLLVIVYSSIGLLIFMMGIWIYLACKLEPTNSVQEKSVMLIFILKYYSAICQIYVSLLTLPMFDAFLTVVWCQPQYFQAAQSFTCYTGIHLVHMMFTLVGMLLLALFALIFTFFFTNYNPSKTGQFVGQQSDAVNLRLLLKFVWPVLVAFDANQTFVYEYIIAHGLVYYYSISLRLSQAPQYNKFVYWFTIVNETALLWVAINMNIAMFCDLNGVDDIGLLYLFVTLPLIIFGMLHKFLEKRKDIYGLQSIKKGEDMDFYFIILYELIQKRKEQESKILLFGMLKLHYSKCHRGHHHCCCHLLIQLDHKKEETLEDQKNWYRLYRSIIEDLLEDEFKKCSRLHLLYAYIANDLLKNPFKSLYELMIAEENKPNYREEFSIFCYKNYLELKISEKDNQNKGESIETDVIVHFQDLFVRLYQDIEITVEFHLNFWRELQEDNPNIHKLENLANKVQIWNQTCQGVFDELQELNSENIKCTELYTYFLLDVVHNEESGLIIKDRLTIVQDSMHQKQLLSKAARSGEVSQDTCVIAVSGNHNTLGSVLSCNNEIIDLLEFFQSDLIGQNIMRIMPKVIGEAHDEFMQKFLSSSKQSVMGKSRNLFAQNKSGYLVQCNLVIKVLPDLSKGIQIIGFLKGIDRDLNEIFVMYDANTLQVHGITESFYHSFGVSSEILFGSGQEFFLDFAFKDLIEQMQDKLPSFDAMFSGQGNQELKGVETIIDTTQLPYQYQLPQQHDLDKKRDLSIIINIQKDDENHQSYNESVIYKLFRKSKARVQLIEETMVGEACYHVLQVKEIFETPEQEIQAAILSQQVTQRRKDLMVSSKNTKKSKPSISDDDPHEKTLIAKGEKFSDNQSSEDVGSMIEAKHLKDFKSIITQKTTPKQINQLKYLSIILVMVMFGLSLTKLVLALRQGDFVFEGINSVSNGYKRHSLMADVNLYCRQLALLGQNKLKYKNITQWEAAFKNNLSVMVQSLQTIQFDVIKARITMNNRIQTPPPLETYPIVFLLQSNTTKIYQNIFNDALFQYITSASTIMKSELGSFMGNDSIQDTDKSLFFVIQNGLFVLRQGSEKIADLFFQFYIVQDNFQANSTIVLAVAVVTISLLGLCFLPIVRKIDREITTLVSLFGKIPVEDMKDLIVQGDEFQKDFIEKYRDKQDDQEVNLNTTTKTTHPQYMEINLEDHIEIKEDDEKQSLQDMKQSSVLSNKEKKNKFQTVHKEKSLKLMESRDTNKVSSMMKYLMVAAFFIVEYIILYTLESQFSNQIVTSLYHLRDSSTRISGIKYDVLFTLEDIVNGVQANQYNGTNLMTVYNERVFVNEENLFNSLALAYPKELNNYLELFADINYYNMCNDITWISDPLNITQGFIFDPTTNTSQAFLYNECMTTIGGLLQNGLRMAILLVNSNTAQLRNLIQEPGKTQADRLKVLNSHNLYDVHQMMKYIVPTLVQLDEMLQDELTEYKIYLIFKIYNFIAFVLIIFIGFIFVWIPYLKSVEQHLWRSKMMLSMIPLSTIQKTKSLRDAIAADVLHQDIQEENKY